MMTIFRRAALLAFCFAPSAAVADGFEPIGELEARIVATLGAGIGEPGGPATAVDRRLKLAACPEMPEIAVPSASSAIVRCTSLGWRIYVPLVRRDSATGSADGQSAPLVHSGDQVEVVATGPGFTVTTFAQAEQEGAQGDRIRVRIKPGSSALVGEVIGSGRVAISELN